MLRFELQSLEPKRQKIVILDEAGPRWVYESLVSRSAAAEIAERVVERLIKRESTAAAITAWNPLGKAPSERGLKPAPRPKMSPEERKIRQREAKNRYTAKQRALRQALRERARDAQRAQLITSATAGE